MWNIRSQKYRLVRFQVNIIEKVNDETTHVTGEILVYAEKQPPQVRRRVFSVLVTFVQSIDELLQLDANDLRITRHQARDAMTKSFLNSRPFASFL